MIDENSPEFKEMVQRCIEAAQVHFLKYLREHDLLGVDDPEGVMKRMYCEAFLKGVQWNAPDEVEGGSRDFD